MLPWPYHVPPRLGGASTTSSSSRLPFPVIAQRLDELDIAQPHLVSLVLCL